jgi:hypothetical protein
MDQRFVVIYFLDVLLILLGCDSNACMNPKLSLISWVASSTAKTELPHCN